ncbi:hypothetical protein E1263_12670 [Kribbella antibiotica]|uniref:Uncharacterized protein n=1 Tax=Kribbella antibiotica TaxID=190195 RepID=A0A4R4ZSW5_9ACTN|nr:hypothetical protein [Kribbella antibiotica]TDD60102.1 hypothetical protein E1263_12670 [Kribbella antibiotica]
MRRRDERGSSLLLVLVVITVIATALSALLSRADTAQRVSKSLRDQTVASYAADGAMEAAINNLRNSSYNGESGQKCFGLSDSLSLVLFNGLDSAAVTCRPDPKQVVINCCNRPANAVLALGQIPGESGVVVDQPADSTLQVHGNVVSNSPLSVAGKFDPSGLLTLNSGARDPEYPTITTAPPHQSLPGCSAPNAVVTFLPGYYDDAVGLSELMRSDSPCRGSTWWFKPGTYYFDFHNSENPLLDGGSHAWTIDSGTLVGGTRTGTTFPGACASPLDGAADGVRFVFGGDSRLVIKGGKAELCGTYSASQPPIAVQGLTSGAAEVTAQERRPTTVSLLSKFGLSATPARLSTVDGVAASWKSSVAGDSAPLTLGGYNQGSAIPPGSVLESAALKISHRHSDPGTTDRLDLSVDVGAGAPIAATITGGPGGTAYRTESVPLDPERTGALAQAVYDGSFDSASVSLTTRLAAKDDTEDIDAVRLELRYTAPALRAADGCVTAGPYPSNTSACAVIEASGRLFVQGTVDVPKGVLDLSIAPGIPPTVSGGVVVRALHLAATGRLSGVAIARPDDSPGFTFGVQLTAYICPGALLCAASGKPALQARIGLVDADPAHPDAGRRAVTVLGWWRAG